MSSEKNEYSLEVPGDLTIYEGVETKTNFESKLKEHDCINVNLSNVSEIDSSGLQLMIALKNEAETSNKTVNFHSHSPAVIELLDLFDMTSYFGDPVVMEK